MMIDDIKRQFSVPEVARREGLRVNRAGFCDCIFHKEKTASMKLYEDSWYSFCCGMHGDVIDLMKHLHGVSFKEACRLLSGEEVGAKTRRAVAVSKLRQKYAQERKRQRENDWKRINEQVSFWRRLKELNLELLGADSDEYAESLHRYVAYCGQQESLLWDVKYGQKRNSNMDKRRADDQGKPSRSVCNGR